MTPKQARFCAEYVKDLNGTQAAIRAGYSAASAASQAERLLRNDEIAAAVAEGQARILERTEFDAARILEELARLALVNVRDFYDENGQIKPVSAWSQAMGAAVAGTETLLKNLAAGDGVVDKVVKIRLWDKNKALETLAKHLGLLVDRVEVTGSIEVVAGRLQAARKRLAERAEGKAA